ncbi:hypothetical protein ACFXTO_041686 [Malus domestica]
MDDRSERGIDPPLEVEGGVEAGILAHLQPRLADQHQRTSSVLQGEILRSSASDRKGSSRIRLKTWGKNEPSGPDFVAGVTVWV